MDQREMGPTGEGSDDGGKVSVEYEPVSCLISVAVDACQEQLQNKRWIRRLSRS